MGLASLHVQQSFVCRGVWTPPSEPDSFQGRPNSRRPTMGPGHGPRWGADKVQFDPFATSSRITVALSEMRERRQLHGAIITINLLSYFVSNGELVDGSPLWRILEWEFSRRHDLPWWMVVDRQHRIPSIYSPLTRWRQAFLLQENGISVVEETVRRAPVIKRLRMEG